ncbi:MAG: PorP/SprF family type IX secretion system membrane protein [Bacteroidales bacterium]|nr:PorP/SprF family type IX secretion system membrane protein [Bacteroidales bacterium]
MKSQKRITSFYVLMTLICARLVAQDVHFTQYYASPLTQNPANTGWYEGDCRISANYRNQWKAIAGKPYSTFGVAFDKPYYFFSEKFSYGVQFINDKSGTVGLSVNKIYASLAYYKKIAGHEFQIAIQPGYVNKSTNMDEYTFDGQFTLGGEEVFGGEFSGEGSAEGINYFDLNAGLLWSNQLTEKIRTTVGMSLFHLTTPNESFFGTKSDVTQLAIRKVIHANASFKLGKSLRLVPNTMYMAQRKATEWLIGANLEVDLNPKTIKTVYFGTIFRYGWKENFDASAWIVGARIKQFDLGLSYDFNVSSLAVATNNRGALELSLSYICKSTQPVSIKIPCDRY